MKSDSALPVIYPEWPAPESVKALKTTRQGGVSVTPFASLNLGDHVQDDPESVRQNRAKLKSLLPSEPVWLSQVHGVQIVDATTCDTNTEADASFTTSLNTVSCVMTADCLPVLFCDQAGTQVAAAHAGWRGLLDGVLEATLSTFQLPDSVLIWFGAAIGPETFEVGPEVKAAFEGKEAQAASFFSAKSNGKYLADIYGLARLSLQKAGVKAENIYGGDLCTVTDSERFFSFRRDGQTGRMATCIWLED